MGRHHAIAVALVAICGVALLGVGLRYALLRHDRRSTEHTVAELKDTTRRALRLLHAVAGRRQAADGHNDTARAERDRERSLALGLHAALDRAQAETTSAAVGAFTSGAAANNLAACLTGVSQALNQLSVGDGHALASLAGVDGPCRQAGVA